MVTTDEDSLVHMAFDNSCQANIITITDAGKIVIANSAACKLLGYSSTEILSQSELSIFDITQNGFKKMLKQRKNEKHASAFLTAKKKNGESFFCEITSTVFMDNHGIGKAITTITDITQKRLNQKNIDKRQEQIVAHDILLARTKQKNIDARNDQLVEKNITMAKSRQVKIDIRKEKIVAENIILALAKADARLDDNNEWIKHIAKVSYDVMWDWNVTTGQIYVGESFEEVFGYKLQNNFTDFKSFTSCLVPEQAERIEKKLLKTFASHKKTWNDSYQFKRWDGSIATTDNRAIIVRDEAGKAIHLIGATQDISRFSELERKLESQIIIRNEFNKIFSEATKLSFEGIWEWNLVTNRFNLGAGFNKLFGNSLRNKSGNIRADWGDYLHSADKAIIEKDLYAAMASTSLHWEQAYQFTRIDGSVANVFNRANILRNADGQAYRMIGVMRDVSKIKRLEEKLEQEIKQKEIQIADATEDARDLERSDIGKELHNNVNQLLGASKMYLEMGKKGGENSEMLLNRSSEYTLDAIEEIRKLTKGLIIDIIKNLGLVRAIENISNDTMEVNPVRIKCVMKKFIEDSVNEKFKLNVFRIVQEQLNNILKHAKATKINIRLLQNDESVILAIADDGVGFDTSKNKNGISLDNIKSRASAYNGTVDFVSQAGRGCVLSAKFPLTPIILQPSLQ